MTNRITKIFQNRDGDTAAEATSRVKELGA